MSVRVLHVDDEPDIREIVDLSLSLDPALCTRNCANGAEAVAIAAQWKPDLILLDVIMPQIDGPATLARLRARTETAHIPVVFMTARAQVSERDRLMALGAAGVICKPFEPMTLAALVRCYMPAAQSRVAAMGNAFLLRARGDANMLLELRGRLVHGRSPAILGRIEAIVQNLAAMAPTYGFAGIGDAARALKAALAAPPPDAPEWDAVAPAIEHLVAEIDGEETRRCDA